MKKKTIICLVMVCYAYCAKSFSDDIPNVNDDISNVSINISGRIVANSSCSFNAGDSLEVKFGDIEFEPVAGKNTLQGEYRQPLNTDITCKGYEGQALQMSLRSVNGNTIQYEGQIVQPVTINNSNLSDELSIRLLVNGEVKDFNSSFPLDVETPPHLEVELVQTGDGHSFTNGASITAGAILVLEFV